MSNSDWFPDFSPLFGFAVFSFWVFLPLALWKAVDIVLWIIHHVKIQIN